MPRHPAPGSHIDIDQSRLFDRLQLFSSINPDGKPCLLLQLWDDSNPDEKWTLEIGDRADGAALSSDIQDCVNTTWPGVN